VLRLKAEVIEHFAAQVKRLVTLELQDKNFLRQIILAIAGRVAPEPQDTRAMDLLLANAWFTEAGTTDSTSEPLGHFILGVSQEMLRQGMTLKPAKDDTPGLRLRLVGEEVEIEVTDQAISALLLKHLLPRFRAMIDGMA
jgi:V/A-type H+-transporting ATPase subunit E